MKLIVKCFQCGEADHLTFLQTCASKELSAVSKSAQIFEVNILPLFQVHLSFIFRSSIDSCEIFGATNHQSSMQSGKISLKNPSHPAKIHVPQPPLGM
jgi:hypothetical protein